MMPYYFRLLSLLGILFLFECCVLNFNSTLLPSILKRIFYKSSRSSLNSIMYHWRYWCYSANGFYQTFFLRLFRLGLKILSLQWLKGRDKRSQHRRTLCYIFSHFREFFFQFKISGPFTTEVPIYFVCYQYRFLSIFLSPYRVHSAIFTLKILWRRTRCCLYRYQLRIRMEAVKTITDRGCLRK